MDIKNVLSVFSGIIFAIAYIPYIRTILNGKTRPSKASWIIWASLDVIVLVGMMVKHTANYQIATAVIGSGTVAVLSLKYGTSGWTKLDKLCLIGAILGIILWLIFDNPIFGILTSLGIMFIGSIPTFVSAWADPSREDKLAWTIFWTSCVFALLAVPAWTIEDAAQPITFFAVQTVMMYILYIKSPAH